MGPCHDHWGDQGVMGLEPGGLRQWWWELGEKVQAKRLFASMYISLVQDLLKDGHVDGAAEYSVSDITASL